MVVAVPMVFPKQARLKKQSGLTLLELIVTIIIIGVLSATILPRFSGSEGYEEYAYRAQAIATLRNIQLRTMQQRIGDCYEVAIDATRLGIPDQNPCSASRGFSGGFGDDNVNFSIATQMRIESGHDVTFSNVGGNFVMSFDRLGRPLGSCNGGCNIEISGLETITIRIESEGYIYASD
ncbi:type II secretion system protein [Thalassotalea sp. M1531]|uniref:Type II secretion system protein n=1 Tax=Thalassotalea algicola TaxID=2716224 RepID=A0A7Y0LCC2_9GAMM|nr:type II secretion system protein [Thalassotalea algicola]NMP31933.1 type II secretion system protein [Thalassotalea algicola]